MNPKYRIEFLNCLDEKEREKIYYNLKKSQITNDNTLFKKLNDEIWEFRTLYKQTQYRLFAFWDKTDKMDKKDTLVISTHGIIKKTQKTPKKEIIKAENLRKQYYKELKR